jgi:hypothetical protein
MTQIPPSRPDPASQENVDPQESAPAPPTPEEVALFQARKGNDFASSAAMVKDILEAESTPDSNVQPSENQSRALDADRDGEQYEPPPTSPSAAPLAPDFFTTSTRRKKRFKR